MRHFRLCSRSSFRAADREEANFHMLRKQDPYRSLDKLHDDKEEAFGSGIHLREVPTLHLEEQDQHLH